MYGNNRKPGIHEGDKSRFAGTIWLGYPEATWFRTATVKGEDATAKPLPLGSIVKEVFDEGTYVPIKETDIAAAAAGIPGPRLGIVADENVTITDEGSSVLLGISGQVDQGRLLIGAKKFEDLTDEQKVHLRQQLESWGFALEVVQQS